MWGLDTPKKMYMFESASCHGAHRAVHVSSKKGRLHRLPQCVN